MGALGRLYIDSLSDRWAALASPYTYHTRRVGDMWGAPGEIDCRALEGVTAETEWRELCYTNNVGKKLLLEIVHVSVKLPTFLRNKC